MFKSEPFALEHQEKPALPAKADTVALSSMLMRVLTDMAVHHSLNAVYLLEPVKYIETT